MKGLLLKDWYTLIKQMKIMLVLMLVFACGLMVALIMALKLDPARLDQAVVEYKDDTSSAAVIQSDGAGMEEVGTVYKDPKTGITYITKE